MDTLDRLLAALDERNLPALYVLDRFQAWRDKRNAVTNLMISSARQRRSEYDPQLLEQIRKIGGSEVFLPITATKCTAAESWIRETLNFQTGLDELWDVEPTAEPVPDEKIKLLVRSSLQRALLQMMAAGESLPSYAQVKSIASSIVFAYRTVAWRKALDAARRARQLIKDVLMQSNFAEVVDAFLYDLVTFPAACIKGPSFTTEPVIVTNERETRLILTERSFFTRVSPFDIYPEPGATDLQSSNFIELVRLSPDEVLALRGSPHVDDTQVELAYYKYKNGFQYEADDDALRKVLYDQPAEKSGRTIQCLHFWGRIPGSVLRSWKINEDLKANSEYDTEILLVGDVPVKVRVRKIFHHRPYYLTSFDKIAGTIWGEGIPQKLSQIQRIANSLARALINNAALSSGPQTALDPGAFPPDQDINSIWPHKIWHVESLGGKAGSGRQQYQRQPCQRQHYGQRANRPPGHQAFHSNLPGRGDTQNVSGLPF